MKIARSLPQVTVLFLLSFLLTIAINPVKAQVNPPIAIVQSQTSSFQQIQQAHTLYNNGRFQEALPLLQQAAATFEKQGDRINQGMALSNLAAALAQLQQWEQAEQTVNASLSLLQGQSKTAEQQRILAQTQDIKGQLQLEQGNVQDALEIWIQSTKIYQAIDAKEALIQSQVNQSLALQSLGLYPRACKTLLESLKLESQTCELSATALPTLKNYPVSVVTVRAMNSLGHVLRVLGQLDQSQKILSIALPASEQLGIPQEQAAIYLNLGNTARAFANQPALTTAQRTEFEQSASIAYKQSAQLATRSDTRMQAQLNQLSLLVDEKNWSETEKMWRSLQPQVSQFPPNQAGIYAQVNLAQSLMKIAERSSQDNLFREVEQILNRANQQAKLLSNTRTQAYILSTQGKLYELQKQQSQAEFFTNQALSLAPAFKSPDIAYQLLWQLGRIKKAKGDTEGAISQYTQAVNILASLRSDLVNINPEVQFSFRESVEPVYRELVGLLLQEKSPSQAKLKLARQTIESLQLAELDNFFRDACADAKQKSIEEVDPTAAIIYPIILSDRLEVILSIPGKPLQHYSTQKSQAELEKTFRQVRNSIRQTSSTTERFPLAQQVYDWLIRPLEKDLTASNIKTLVFILDGYLRNIPMAILHDGQQYLIEKYSIALTPGLQLVEPRPLTQIKLKVLTGALTEARQGFVALPGVEREIEEISATIPTITLLNQQFLSTELQARIKAVSYPIVHLATHGQFSSNATETFILTWDERVNVKEFNHLLRSRSEDKKSPIELLIFSACQTAAGDDRAALGLAGAAIRSGARSTMGTLWSVNDESTALFMSEFYRQLAKSNISKAEAIRNAQITLLQNKQFQHPFFWSPFVLVGNWQ
ncbi:MAG TPA: CHAT domain-containing protein [Kamptonema sp.]|nr:CHAT domain-containing protein [Kamptonema sp.]